MANPLPDAVALSKMQNLDPEALKYAAEVLRANYPKKSAMVTSIINKLDLMSEISAKQDSVAGMKIKCQEQTLKLQELDNMITEFCKKVESLSTDNQQFGQLRIDYAIADGQVLVGVNTNLGGDDEIRNKMFEIVNHVGSFISNIQSIDGRMYDAESINLPEENRQLAEPYKISQIFNDIRVRFQNRGIDTAVYTQIFEPSLTLEETAGPGVTPDEQSVVPE